MLQLRYLRATFTHTQVSTSNPHLKMAMPMLIALQLLLPWCAVPALPRFLYASLE